jgi:hypothetical protein
MTNEFDDHTNDPALEPGPNARKLYKDTKVSDVEGNKTSQLKISKGVAEAQYLHYKNSLGLLIRTLRRASLRQRLVYLLTCKIPQTPGQLQAEGVETYDDWMRH